MNSQPRVCGFLLQAPHLIDPIAVAVQSRDAVDVQRANQQLRTRELLLPHSTQVADGTCGRRAMVATGSVNAVSRECTRQRALPLKGGKCTGCGKIGQ